MKGKVQLDAVQQQYLQQYITKGIHSARSIRRARALLLLSEGMAQKQVAGTVDCCEGSIINLLHRYKEVNGAVEQAITERPRSGQPPIVTPAVEAHITALACSKAPDGRSEWTLRMIADKVVELGYVGHLSHEAVRGVLKKVNSSPGKSANGVSAK
jgi:putative transposase